MKANKQKRFAELAKRQEIIFHSKDLAVLWNIKNTNTLHTTLKRYVQQGLLFRIYNGFYALKPIHELDPLLLGIKALHGYGYISTETVLARAGIIEQHIEYITLIGAQSKRFTIKENHYYVRQLTDKFLYNPIGIKQEHGVKKATRLRAVADMLYFNPKAHFDAQNSINWAKVAALQKKIGYPLTPDRYV